MNILIIIPSYNDSHCLPKLIPSIQSYTSLPILIIDDGSKNPISLTANNTHIIRNKINLGKGAAIKKGLIYALKMGYSHVITLDSDLQHDPLELATFLDSNSDLDFVLGYRERNKDMPILRKFSNWITSRIISKLTGVDVLDSQCGYRRYSLEAIDEIKFIETGFQFESEVLIKGLRAESKIEQVKISTIYDKDNKSYIKHFSDTLKFIQLILRSILRK